MTTSKVIDRIGETWSDFGLLFLLFAIRARGSGRPAEAGGSNNFLKIGGQSEDPWFCVSMKREKMD